MKQVLVSVITSEKTYQKLPNYLFNSNFFVHRKYFDIAVVLNGYDKTAADFIHSYNPEFFYQRENLGRDPAGVDFLIKKIPIYDYTLILHDDHSFNTANWLEKLLGLATHYPEIDVWGNVLYQTPLADYEKFCDMTNALLYKDTKTVGFLHGLSGFFNKRAISVLKNSGVPHINTNERYWGLLSEFLFSNILQHNNLSVAQIPPGIFLFLEHGSDSKRFSLVATANMYYFLHDFSQSELYYFKFLEACVNEGVDEHKVPVYNSLGNIYFLTKDYSKAKLYYQMILEIDPIDEYALNMIKEVTDLLNLDS